MQNFVSVGGFLGMGEHYVAVNPASVKLTYNNSDKKWHTGMNANADQLKNAPEFKYTVSGAAAEPMLADKPRPKSLGGVPSFARPPRESRRPARESGNWRKNLTSRLKHGRRDGRSQSRRCDLIPTPEKI